MQNNSQKLGTESIIPLLIRLSIPSIIAMAIQALYNVVDSIYVGRISTDALSALSLAFPIQIILIGIGVGTGVGASSLISRRLGENNEHAAVNAAEHSIMLSVFYGIIVAIFGFFFSDQILQLFTNEANLIRMGSEYIKIILIGSIAMFFPMISNNILRGEGNTFTPMIAMLIGSILNIILDPFLIYGLWIFPEMGVAGAAIATVAARIISGSFLVYILLFSRKNELQISLKDFSFDFQIIRDIYVVGFPAMVMQFLASFMLGGMNRILAGFGSTAIAAAGIYFRLQSFIFMPVFGLNQGYMPIMGYNFGHNNPERMKKTFKSALLVAVIFTTTGFIIFQTVPELLIKMFNSDPELLKIGTDALKKISIAFPVIGPAIIISTTFQALGNGFPSLVFSFLRQIVVLLPVMYFLGHWFGLEYLWFAFPISEAVSIFPASIWLRYKFNRIFINMEAKQKT
ncbi:putative MATE family efflux protein [Halanaerobium saccharolyticum]|uniref:Probable multidrug resistance protein NorM n=1 Tax=Halanaerobium saccharolyticum TaxID=43595 RepID=A0A4R7YWZ8_9FIRM|nr:MATE family efflux transporter [Halanaerobium saccharolyticum]RAK07125.1 putative MATE family efflux protein [Halanaerobium saccharolyticum]TDW01863.1 putative MATE family efflux protein [Halanaerobium saccharolyticum]TDX53109.1 putative MATE family efflux protein [Halanaerobium saccharolyticum]